MIEKLVVIKIKNNQIIFEHIPKGLGIKVKDFDLKVVPYFLEEDDELQRTLGVQKCTESNEWFKPSMYVSDDEFTNLDYVFEDENNLVSDDEDEFLSTEEIWTHSDFYVSKYKVEHPDPEEILCPSDVYESNYGKNWGR